MQNRAAKLVFFFFLWEKHTYLTSVTICCVSHLENKIMANKECHYSERQKNTLKEHQLEDKNLQPVWQRCV